MPERLEAYLNELRAALEGCDPAVLQDALWDAENHLRTELAAHRWNFPELSEDQVMDKVTATFGTPQEVAEAYRDRETVVAEALRTPPVRPRPARAAPPPPALDTPAEPWPGFLEVLWTPKVYTSVFYLLLSMVTGIFYFAWVTTGLSLSFGLSVLIIGLPFAIAFLASVRVLALGEGRLVEALLDVRMPRRPPLLPEGKGWMERLGNLIRDGHTWSSLAYLLLHLPLGILSFTVMSSFLALSLSLLVAPIVHLLVGQAWGSSVEQLGVPAWALLAFCAAGFVSLVGTLHLALLLGRFQGWLAKQMLVRR